MQFYRTLYAQGCELHLPGGLVETGGDLARERVEYEVTRVRIALERQIVRVGARQRGRAAERAHHDVAGHRIGGDRAWHHGAAAPLHYRELITLGGLQVVAVGERDDRRGWPGRAAVGGQDQDEECGDRQPRTSEHGHGTS